MVDLTILYSRAFETAYVQGETEAGVDYVGTIFVRGMEVLDADRVRVPVRVISNIQAEARKLGLTFTEER